MLDTHKVHVLVRQTISNVRWLERIWLSIATKVDTICGKIMLMSMDVRPIALKPGHVSVMLHLVVVVKTRDEDIVKNYRINKCR